MTLPLEDLAGLLIYPSGPARTRLAESLVALPDPRGHLKPLFEALRDRAAEELEELYTRTFDINPVCTLEVGWHIFGEDYNRGAMLVTVRGLLREHGLEEGTELPDHLATMLPLLGHLPDEAAGHWARRFVLPALGKMLAGFADETNPYRTALVEIEHLLRTEYGEPEDATTTPQPYDCAAGCPALDPGGE